jgi:hypothetical protein
MPDGSERRDRANIHPEVTFVVRSVPQIPVNTSWFDDGRFNHLNFDFESLAFIIPKQNI